MKLVVETSGLNGSVVMPASKSHTIRAVVIGALASGSSEIINPLHSSDTLSAVSVCQGLGARIDNSWQSAVGSRQRDVGAISLADGLLQPNLQEVQKPSEEAADELPPDHRWIVQGTGGRVMTPEDVLDVGNSGTTLYIAMGMASLGEGYSIFTGDDQIRRRPAKALIDSLNSLGASVFSTRGNDCAPLVVKGKINGGEITVDGSKTSQYISSLLISCPLAEGDTQLRVVNITERPYIQMTLDWLIRQGIRIEHNQMEEFYIHGGQRYEVFKRQIPGDFSSATFFLGAGALGSNEILLRGLDMNDSQADKAVVDYLREMGARVSLEGDGIRVCASGLRGVELDMNATPDALPMMAVLGCFAAGKTVLANVAQARFKETDRIAVMCQELSKMGARIRELPDGLVIEESELSGALVDGHNDHRVVMALAVAGLAAKGETIIDTAEAMQITFPNFAELMQQVGGNVTLI